jgi:hypothetical protein
MGARDSAKRSADHLPPRSQAFAAVLCASLRWARSNNDHDLATSLYQRYVLEGAYVGWSAKFGGRCEQPDFDRASALLWDMRMKSARAALRPYKIPLVGLAVAAVVAVALFVARRRKAADED